MQDTNAVIDSETSFDFSDYSEEVEDTATEAGETTEETSEGSVAEQAENATQTENLPETTVNIKFLGKETAVKESAMKEIADKFNISVEEAQAVIQKGFNYDHAVEKAKNTEDRQLIEALAKSNGQSPEEYRKFLAVQTERIARDKVLNAVKAEYPDLEDEALEIIAKERFERGKLADYKESKEKEEKAAVEAQQQAEAAENQLKEAIFKFHQAYPDVKEFPEDVAKMIDQGYDPIMAYQQHLQREENEKLKTEIAQLKQGNYNYYSSMGSSQSNAQEEKDDFLEGWG